MALLMLTIMMIMLMVILAIISNYHDGVDTDNQHHTINLYDHDVLGGHDNGFSFDA